MIPGLVEHWFPKPGPIHPFVDDGVRKFLNKDVTRLWTAGEYRIREELLFTIALDRSTSDLILSRPKMDLKGRELHHSVFLEELLPRLQNLNELQPDLQTSSVRRLMTSYLDEEEKLLPDALEYLKGEHQKELCELIRKREIENSRLEGEEGAYSGIINGDGLFTQKRGVAVTDLERYGRCPFSFLCSDVLKLQKDKDEEEGLLPINSGILLHKILQNFYEERLKSQKGPVTPSNLRGAIGDMEELASDVLEKNRESHPSLSDTLWWSETELLKRVLLRVVRQEAAYFEKKRLYPKKLEQKFNIDLTEIKEDLGKKWDGLRGQIDRIDESEDGSLFVLDYKRGKQVSTAADIKKGINLQLPLYIFAAQKIFNRPAAGGAYYALGDAKMKGKLPAKNGFLLEDSIKRSLQWAENYLEGIDKGRFPVKPKACLETSCDFHRICRVGRNQ
ncbi:PD-(D/E)XK nuclease family protein [Bdellovibrionota bacterium]